MKNNETNEEKTKRLKNINYILDECYDNSENFYGTYYEDYKPIWLRLLILIPVLALFVFFVFIVAPLAEKATNIKYLRWILTAIISVIAIGAVTTMLEKPLCFYYIKNNGKPICIYWKKLQPKKFIIVDLGHDKSYKYTYSKQCWRTYEDSLVKDKLLFNKITENSYICDDGKGVTIIKENSWLNPNKTKIKLTVKNRNPVCIHYRESLNETSGLLEPLEKDTVYNRRINFISFNVDKYIEIPRSFITYCEKEDIEPPQESDLIHYSK